MNKRLRAAPESVDLLVVGAGPVGLLAALAGAEHGLAVALLDQFPRGFSPGRGCLLHGDSLGLLASYGLLEMLRARGRLLDQLVIRTNDGSVLRLDLEHPVLALTQDDLEEILRAELKRRGVVAQAPRQASSLEQTTSEVEVRVLQRELVRYGSPALYSDWETQSSGSIRAKFVIGADGYDSRIRAALGIETLDLGNTESFAMFDFDTVTVLKELCLSFEGELMSSLLPLPGARIRGGFQIDRELSETPDLERLRELLRRRRDPTSPEPTALGWSSVTHFERRLTRHFGRGRVWLAGDAAHITAPFGNHSVNAGLEEADALVRRMADCIAGRATPETLEEYGAERQREWHKLLGVNVSFDVLPHAPRWLIPHARRLVPALPACGSRLTTLLERLGLRLG